MVKITLLNLIVYQATLKRKFLSLPLVCDSFLRFENVCNPNRWNAIFKICYCTKNNKIEKSVFFLIEP